VQGVGPAYAAVVHVWDNLGSPNVTQLNNDPLGTTFIPATAGTAAGFVPGTDAFEVYQGATTASTQRLGAQVSTVQPISATVMQLVISPNPFVPNELAAAGATTGPIVMFWIDDVHCYGRITSLVSATYGVGGTATIQVSTVNSDFAVPGQIWPTGCPRSLQNVEVLERRTRYLVYRTVDAPPGQPARLGLHVQRNAACDPLGAGTVCNPNLQQFPSMVAEGVDDMQVAWNEGILIISGLKRQRPSGRGVETYLCVERAYGHFRREISVKIPVDYKNAKAELRDGLLKIRLPKRTEADVTTIPIL